ncbi:MAG: GTP cyclohydrolase II [Gammaproteobacteria bacterium]|nr:GTP cyclohydrolase II [Gammaproteobacteria bacterium]
MATIRNKIKVLTKYGMSTFVSFHDLDPHKEHFALIFNNADTEKCPFVRVHSECITGDLFGSSKCDCGDQLHESLNLFSTSGGILLYLRQEGRGIGLYNKLDAYAIQEKGFDTFQANCVLNLPEDMRDFSVAAEMLKAMNIEKIHLISNNPDKYKQLKRDGIQIEDVTRTGFYLKNDNKKYLQAKIEHAGHIFKNNILNIQTR